MPDIEEEKKLTLVLPEGEFEFDPDKYLTASTLRHLRGWYPNTELFQYWGFQQALSIGEPNAVAAAIWMIKRKEGYTPNPEPQNFARKIGDPSDFAIGKTIIAPNRRDGVDPPRWKFRPDGDEELLLDMDEHVTCATLRQIQRRYPHLASFAGLYLNLLPGDPDAVAVGIWIARLAAGIQPCPLPWDMEDFSVGAVSANNNLPDDQVEFAEPNPTETGSKSPKAGSSKSAQDTASPSSDQPNTPDSCTETP